MYQSSFSILPTLILSVLTLVAGNAHAANETNLTEKPTYITSSHLNVALSVNDLTTAAEFYGEVLDLKLVSQAEDELLRYASGNAEITLVEADMASSKTNKPANAPGIHLFAIVLPESNRQGVNERLISKGYAVPQYLERAGFRIGFLDDMDGNPIELVFVDAVAPKVMLKSNQIALTVTDMEETSAFLRDILGMQSGNVLVNKTVGEIRNFTLGTSTIKFWQAAMDVAPHVGLSSDIKGITSIECHVSDIHMAKAQIEARGGQIHTAPFAVNDINSAMYVAGPDGILFKFIGPAP